MCQIRVGLVGFGMVAERFHAPLLSVDDNFALTHVVERHQARSQQKYPEVTVVNSHQSLLQQPVDLVVVLTPNESHFTIARDALMAGKHVVLDKPMTVTSAEADELIALAAERELVLTVFHNRRWDSDFLTLKALLAEGKLGRLVELESRFDRFRPHLKGGWREEEVPGAGILYDLGSHLFDQSLHLFGLPKALFGTLLLERSQSKVVDGFRVSLDYQSFFVNLYSSCVAAEPKVRFRARGEQAAWVKYGLDPQEGRLAVGDLPNTEDWGGEGPEDWGRLHASQVRKIPSVPGDYPAFYRELAGAIREGGLPPVSPEDARNVIRMIELCERSHEEKRWVEWA